MSQVLPFQPTQISGCQLWLDGADPNGNGLLPSNGASISTWADKSGNGRNLSQATSINQPTYSNSRVRFSGTQWLRNTISTSFGDSGILFVVANANTGASSGSPINITSVSKVQVGMYLGSQFTSYYYNTTNNQVANVGGTGSLLSVWVNARNGNLNPEYGINGSSLVSYTGIDPSTYNFSGTMEVGSVNNGVNAQFNGNICEILYFNNYLSTIQRQQIEGYLAWKWGLQANLPFNHPFKNAPPFSQAIPLGITPTNAVRLLTSSAFSPTQISGCQLWLDAADRTTIRETAGTVTNVLNKGNSTIILSNANGFTYDRQNKAFVNSLASSGRHLGINSSYTQAQPQTLFAVASFSSSATNPYIIDSRSTQVDVGRFGYSIVRNIANTADVGYVFAGNVNAPDYGLRTAANIPSNTTIIHTLLMNDASSDIRLNGVTQTFIQNPGTNIMTGITIGNRYTLDQSWVGSINEIILFNRALTILERQQIEGYLAWKWGLISNLENNHPSKIAPLLPFSSSAFSQPLVSATFNPRSIAGCQLWLDASDRSTISLSGNTVTQWRDKSGNSRNATPVNSPSYLLNAINLNGSSQYFTCPNVNYSPPQIFIVATNNGTTEGTLIRKGYSSGSDYEYGIASLNSTILRWELRMTGGGQINFSPTVTSTLGRGLFGLTYDNTTGLGFFNGTQVGSGNATGPIFSGASLLFLGVTPSALVAYFNGSLHEYIIYNTAMTINQRQQVEGYLAWKWGLQANLPNNHPWKLFPPPP